MSLMVKSILYFQMEKKSLQFIKKEKNMENGFIIIEMATNVL
jgi:hypothetical protein